MVEINKQSREIKITIGNSDVSTLDLMAKALIDLMQNYNFTEAGSYTGNTFYWALQLLQEMLPTDNQMQDGLLNRNECIELPESMTPNQKQVLREALQMVEHPEVKVRATPNIILEAIKKVAV